MAFVRPTTRAGTCPRRSRTTRFRPGRPRRGRARAVPRIDGAVQPDRTWDVHHVVAEDDLVTLHLTMHATTNVGKEYHGSYTCCSGSRTVASPRRGSSSTPHTCSNASSPARADPPDRRIDRGGSDGRSRGAAIGARVLRAEDPRILTGRGRYVDDVVLPGMLHAAFLRSTVPHGRLLSVDVSARGRCPAWSPSTPARTWPG